jgi:alanine racemase
MPMAQRRLGNGVGRLWLHGHTAPIVGSVCMDMCMLDVTDIPCRADDLAYLFNAEPTPWPNTPPPWAPSPTRCSPASRVG